DQHAFHALLLVVPPACPSLPLLVYADTTRDRPTRLAFRLLEIPVDALEPVHGLPGEPLHHPRVVVAPADNVVERRVAVGLAHPLHLGELRALELVRADDSPVVRR